MQLQKDLEELVSANVITEETAGRIDAYYRQKASQPSNRFAIVLSILGSLLVGLGIVLVVAHNWDDFSKPVKTIFAFLPLVLGQGLCAFALIKRSENLAWRESASGLLFFGVAASISLVSQIYHISGALSGFLFTWLVLTLPLIYVMRSHVTAFLFISVATWYAAIVGYNNYPHEVPYYYLVMMLAVIPAYQQVRRNNRSSNIFILYNWFLAVSFIAALGAFADEHTTDEWVFIGYLSLFCTFHGIGTDNFFSKQRLFANPYLLLALPGIIIILLCWTFEWLWRDDDGIVRYILSWDSAFLYISLLLLFLSLSLLVKRYSRAGSNMISPTGFSAVVLSLALLLFAEFTPGGVFTVNAWVLALGLYYTRKGSIRQHLGILNFGLLIIAALAVMRFFDDSIPFVWRGIFFLLAGIGFFVANYLVIKKRKSAPIKPAA
jgi:hypothetical protein